MMENMKERTRNDLKLIGALLFASLFLSLVMYFFASGDGAFVRVSVDGAVTAEYDLHKEQTAVIEGAGGFENTLVIKEGKADIVDAGCPDKLCVYQKEISRTGESLVCLPNRVVVEIVGADGNEVDAIAD